MRNSPAVGIDPLGLNLYAIDGTWARWGQGTNTELIFRLSMEPGAYWKWPGWGLTGMDSVGIAAAQVSQLFWRHDGSPTSHGDIGANMLNNDAFYWMRDEARAAGVKLN